MSKKGIAILDEPQQKMGVEVAGAPSQEEIAVRAHELFIQRGGVSGHELEDWLLAEQELREKR